MAPRKKAPSKKAPRKKGPRKKALPRGSLRPNREAPLSARALRQALLVVLDRAESYEQEGGRGTQAAHEFLQDFVTASQAQQSARFDLAFDLEMVRLADRLAALYEHHLADRSHTAFDLQAQVIELFSAFGVHFSETHLNLLVKDRDEISTAQTFVQRSRTGLPQPPAATGPGKASVKDQAVRAVAEVLAESSARTIYGHQQALAELRLDAEQELPNAFEMRARVTRYVLARVLGWPDAAVDAALRALSEPQ